MPSVAGSAAYVDAFKWNYAEYALLLKGDIMKDLVRRGILVQRLAVSAMGKVAPPAPAGHAPAVRTGTLRRSIAWKPGIDSLSPYVDIGSNVLYAPYVELGTSRMEARPFLRPALEGARATFI
jgi:hypothetical protein